jgi:hypothetical protein
VDRVLNITPTPDGIIIVQNECDDRLRTWMIPSIATLRWLIHEATAGEKNSERFRITYSTDGITFKHIDSFSEIPAGPGDKLFMDTLPPQHTDGAIELMRRGVEVYYLRRITLIEKIRKEHKLPKSARGDIKALMSIEERWFRRVTEDFLVLRRMILAHRSLSKTHQQLMNKYRALSEAEREVLKPAISSIEKQLEEVARMIAGEAGKRYPAYNVILEGLG